MTDLTDPDATPQPMARLAAVAERLRSVRRAHERFLALWAVDHLLTATADRVTPDNRARPAGSNHPRIGGRLNDDH